MKTNKAYFRLLILVTWMICCTQVARAQPVQAKTSGYAPVNGLSMYYETYGQGDPIVLLHGGFLDIQTNFGALIPELAKTHRVIALEMQGHGRTADISRPLSYSALASDVAGLLNYLKIDSATILGYSLGATVALQLALLHPEQVKKLVFISSVYKLSGWIQPVRDAFARLTPDMLSHTPLKAAYNRLAPDTLHWHAFVGKVLQFENTPFDLGIDHIRKMKAPVLFIKGDNDGVDYAHLAELYTSCGGAVFGDMQGLPKSQLAVLPGATHVSVMMQTAQLSQVITNFLQ